MLLNSAAAPIWGFKYMNSTVEDLLSLVPEGGSQIFKAAVPDRVENRFFSVAFNHDHRGTFAWKNKHELTRLPWMGARDLSRRGLDDLAVPDVSFSLKEAKLVDFYSTGTAAYAISNKLRDLI